WLRRSLPVANGVNATGIVGTTRLPAASTRPPPPNTPVRPGLPSLKMITPEAPAACAFSALVPKVHVPRWISATRPGTKPLKSLAVQPLDELGDGVGGMTMPPAGCRSAVVDPVLWPGFQSLATVKSCDVGDTSRNVGSPV